jgi:uncharacterized protein YndB with AHSA1/START domain
MILLTIFLIVIPVILIAAFFICTGINAETTIDINKPQQEVFDYLVLLKNQEHYNAWLMTDPQMSKDYTGTDGRPGFILSWNSKNKITGKASQQITNIVAPEKIEIELIFEKPLPSKARYWLKLTAVNDSKTHVTWIYQGNPAPYYLLRVSHMVFRLKKRATGYMQVSLANLKNILEN